MVFYQRVLFPILNQRNYARNNETSTRRETRHSKLRTAHRFLFELHRCSWPLRALFVVEVKLFARARGTL